MSEGAEKRRAAYGLTERPVRRVGPGGAAAAPEPDALAVEEPLEIRLAGETLAVTLRTPGEDARLALGFLLAEGLIAGRADVLSVRALDGPEGLANAVDVAPRKGASSPERTAAARRGTLTTAACGLCGRRSVADLIARAGRVPEGPAVAAGIVAGSVERLRARQLLFRATGSIHAAAALDPSGAILAASEDVGRHNAVDKVVGALLERDGLGEAAILVVSGRVSFEIVQKAAVARIPVVSGVSGPSSLAVDLADAAGIALAGFVRGGRFNLYTHPERLSALAPPEAP